VGQNLVFSPNAAQEVGVLVSSGGRGCEFKGASYPLDLRQGVNVGVEPTPLELPLARAKLNEQFGILLAATH